MYEKENEKQNTQNGRGDLRNDCPGNWKLVEIHSNGFTQPAPQGMSVGFAFHPGGSISISRGGNTAKSSMHYSSKDMTIIVKKYYFQGGKLKFKDDSGMLLHFTKEQ